MRRARQILITVTVVTAVGAGAGCEAGSDVEPGVGSSSSAPPAVDQAALRAGLVALWTGDDTGPRDTRNGECFADALLERTTPDQLRASGVLDASYAVVEALPVLDAATAEPWVDAQLACTDFVEESTRALVAQRKGAIARGTYAACLRDTLSDDELRAALVQTLTGGFESPEVAALSEAQQTCAQAARLAD